MRCKHVKTKKTNDYNNSKNLKNKYQSNYDLLLNFESPALEGTAAVLGCFETFGDNKVAFEGATTLDVEGLVRGAFFASGDFPLDEVAFERGDFEVD